MVNLLTGRHNIANFLFNKNIWSYMIIKSEESRSSKVANIKKEREGGGEGERERSLVSSALGARSPLLRRWRVLVRAQRCCVQGTAVFCKTEQRTLAGRRRPWLRRTRSLLRLLPAGKPRREVVPPAWRRTVESRCQTGNAPCQTP